MENPNIVSSGLSKYIELEELQLNIEIYRLEYDPKWALEVVDQHGTSTVWDELFETDQAAFDEVMRTIKDEGAAAFRESGNVIQFPKK